MIIPAKILNGKELVKSIFPTKVADAPNTINTTEKPNENKIVGIKLTFFDSSNFSSVVPDIYEIYPGIRGKTHGDKKLIKPALIATKISVILTSIFHCCRNIGYRSHHCIF